MSLVRQGPRVPRQNLWVVQKDQGMGRWGGVEVHGSRFVRVIFLRRSLEREKFRGKYGSQRSNEWCPLPLSSDPVYSRVEADSGTDFKLNSSNNSSFPFKNSFYLQLQLVTC